MSIPWAFVCPSSRGIGRAVTQRLLLTTSLPILATTRHSSPSDAKSEIIDGLDRTSSDADKFAKRLSIVPCDVTDDASVAKAAAEAERMFPGDSHHLRLALAIPGILHPEKAPKQIDADLALDTFKVNALGPLLLMKYFTQFLPRHKNQLRDENVDQEEKSSSSSPANGINPHAAVWLNMAARVGSTTDNRAGGWYSYRASKAAVMSLTRTLDLHLARGSKDAASLAIAYHPGTVKTGLSKEFWDSVEPDKLFSTEYAAEKLLSVVGGLKEEQRGKCWDYKNEEVPP